MIFYYLNNKILFKKIYGKIIKKNMISLKTKQTFVDQNKARALFEKYDIDKMVYQIKMNFLKL